MLTTDFGGRHDGATRGGDPGERQDRRRRSRPTTGRRLRPRPLQPGRHARHRTSPATASRRPTSGRPRGDRGGAPSGRQDRRGRPPTAARQRLRARPLQPERLARHRASPATARDDRLRAVTRRTGWRSRRTARSSRPAARAPLRQRLRARPLQPERLARHELLRRRHADDRLRRFAGRARWRSRRRQDRRGRQRRGTAASDFALARYNPNGTLDTSFSGDGKQTTDFGGGDEANCVAIQANGKIVAVGPRRRRRRRRLRARPLQHRRLARHRPSPATARRGPTSGFRLRSAARAEWPYRATGRSSRWASALARARRTISR